MVKSGPSEPARRRSSRSLPAIPRAPGLPRFSPPPDARPSYVPGRRSSGHHPAAVLDPPPPGGTPPATEGLDESDGAQISSGLPPPPESGAPPTLFEVASLLDAGSYSEAVDALERLGPHGSPPLALLWARALLGAGRSRDALAALQRLAAAPLLDPEVRAGCARLLLEQGLVDEGLAQARRAHGDDPEPALVQLVLALGLVRAARRGAPTTLYDEADELLHGLRSRTTPHPALVLALRAAAESEVGEPERAIDIAQRALALDPKAPDALAALAIAGARLGRVPDALGAWHRLRDASPPEARVVRRRLDEMGLPEILAATGDGSPGRSPWDAAERRIAAGRRRDATAEVVQWLAPRVDALQRRGVPRDPPLFGGAAAALLTEAPLFRAFAPWDLSLQGVRRLEAALDVLLGERGWTDPTVDERPLLLTLGAYLGESWAVALGATWRPVTSEDPSLHLDGRILDPARRVKERFERGAETSLLGAPPPVGDPAWTLRRPCPVRPPTPWGSAEWPAAELVPELGRALSESAAGSWCAAHAESPLDHTLLSLVALDRWLALLSPVGTVVPVDEPWLARAAVLAGGYLGEALRETVGGSWQEETSAEAPSRYRLVLGDLQVCPVLEVHRRLAGGSPVPLADWAARLLKRLE